MIIGFTGTRYGLTLSQRRALDSVFAARPGTSFHHGGCVGAARAAALLMRSFVTRIVLHPGPESDAYFLTVISDERREPKPHLARNRDIVAASDLIVACPATAEI